MQQLLSCTSFASSTRTVELKAALYAAINCKSKAIIRGVPFDVTNDILLLSFKQYGVITTKRLKRRVADKYELCETASKQTPHQKK